MFTNTSNTIHWEVQKYGTIIDDYESVIHDKYCIRVKHYIYENDYFVEYMCNGVVEFFMQLYY